MIVIIYNISLIILSERAEYISNNYNLIGDNNMRTLLAIAPHSLKSDDLEFIETVGVDSLVLFSTHDNDSSNEMQQKLSIPTSIFSLAPLTTDGYENSDQLQALSWNISKQMFQSVNGIDGSMDVLLGSGTALHDYLLWLVACSVKCENFYHWEGNKLVPYMHNEQHLDSNVAPKIMSALLQLSGTKNSKVFSAQDICELDNVTEMAGVQAAATACESRGLIEVSRDTTRPPLYSLTNRGFPIALKYWMINRQSSDEPVFKKLLVSFGRLFNDGPKNMLQTISKIEAHDSYLFVLQRYLEKSDYSGVLKFSEALGMENLSEIHEDLAECNLLLEKKSKLEDFTLVEPLIVVNPKIDEQFLLNYMTELFKSIISYEYETDEHLWSIDLTSCFAKLRSTISTFSLASDTKICYVLKSKEGVGATGEQISGSPFSRTDHVLEVPSTLAIESLQGLAISKINSLIVMNEFERGRFNQDSGDDTIEDILFATEKPGKNLGLTFKDISEFAAILSEMLGRDISIEQNQTRFADLISNQLISKINDVGKSRFVLTELGEFVANWAIQDLGLE